MWGSGTASRNTHCECYVQSEKYPQQAEIWPPPVALQWKITFLLLLFMNPSSAAPFSVISQLNLESSAVAFVPQFELVVFF